MINYIRSNVTFNLFDFLNPKVKTNKVPYFSQKSYQMKKEDNDFILNRIP